MPTTTTRPALVLGVDLTAAIDSGRRRQHVDVEAIGRPIHPCTNPACTWWHVDILLDPDGSVFAREWHHPACPHLLRLLAGDV